MFDYLEKRKVYLVYIPLIVYWICLLIATSLPTADLPSVAISDKLKHFGAFFGLSILLALTLHYQNKFLLFKKYFLVAALVITSLYGLLDEIHQSFIPGRYNEFMDWVADSLGAIAGILLVFYLMKKLDYLPRTVIKISE
ncbi:MAG: VanZ family protein [Bacteroidetes bacterium]|nr:VanZ family protein [Bacteroidota bacterium]MCH7770473.1 VanZ family protein [Bacteroidota bacterium]